MRPYVALALFAILALAILATPSTIAASSSGDASLAGFVVGSADATQSRMSDSARFVGSVTVDGKPAPETASIVALVGQTNCGFGVVAGGQYRLDVVPDSVKEGCGSPGATVVFVRGSLGESGNLPVGPAGAWDSTRENHLDLSFTTPLTTRPEALSTHDPDITPWLLGALGIIALLFGTVLERRRPNRSP